MRFYDIFFAVGFLGNLLIIAFAWFARAWLLFAGVLLHIPMDIQLLLRKMERLSGSTLAAMPPDQVFVNRLLESCSLVLIIAGTIQVLYRYAQLRRRLSNDASRQHSPNV